MVDNEVTCFAKRDWKFKICEEQFASLGTAL